MTEGTASSRTNPELAVVIPTRDRRSVLLETLGRLARFAASDRIEVIVVDDGSADGGPAAPGLLDPAPAWPLEVLRQDAAGPAAARNRGVRASAAPVCLFLGDDSLPTPGLIERHLAFHHDHPAKTDALLGVVVPAPPLDASPLQRWLHQHGAQFGYAALRPDEPVSPSCFWTSNVSVKRDLLLEVGGFDESFPGAACEDAELGFRLARAGMNLRYHPGAEAQHFHPTNLARVIERQRMIGVAFHRLCELAPEMAPPRPPGARHRLKAAALTAALLAGRTRAAREASWRFLCDEALRESYWADKGQPPRDGLRIGRVLARRALADPLANPPQPAAPDPIGWQQTAPGNR